MDIYDFWKGLVKNMPKPYIEWFEIERNYLSKLITQDANVLDVGCGDGRNIQDIVNISKNITGVDHNPDYIEIAKGNFKDKKVKFLSCEAIDLPFDSNNFDFVICMATFGNFQDQKIQALKEMKRVLRPEGRLILSIFSENSLDARKEFYNNSGISFEVVDDGKIKFTTSDTDASYSEQFNEEEMNSFFSKAGFKVNDVIRTEISYIFTVEELSTKL
jgi:ubiquinone/menaquinone biosynthesis C-methylase UbiE